MHVWVNGTFGVGKTTTATRMRELAPAWRVFDPEWVGYMLRANLGDLTFSDFQDCRRGAPSFPVSPVRSST
jgi:hypothetical protein